ncbi:MAG: NAD(P)-dependent oxidoreductase [Pseudobdellovibrionaceae bacterium]
MAKKINKPLILIADRFSQDSFLYLQEKFSVVKSDHPLHLPGEALLNCEALIIRSRTAINEQLLQKARKLRVIVTATSGFDHIDFKATQKWGITVMHTPWAHVESVAQLTWTLIQACNHNLAKQRENILNLQWRQPLYHKELNGRVLGIVGLGRIGQRVAQLARAAAGMRVQAYDPYIQQDIFAGQNILASSYEDVLYKSDVISFHVPKTAETTGLLKQHHFEKMLQKPIVVNTSRGCICSEEDFLWALKHDVVYGLGLDVFPKEPYPEAKAPEHLLQYSNVIATPHIGAMSEEALSKASLEAAQKISDFFYSGQTSDTLPPKDSWYL